MSNEGHDHIQTPYIYVYGIQHCTHGVARAENTATAVVVAFGRNTRLCAEHSHIVQVAEPVEHA